MCYAPDLVQIEVTDDGPARTNGPLSTSPGTGHGLNGLRERVLALGGKLEAGHVETRGFRVSACLPTTTA